MHGPKIRLKLGKVQSIYGGTHLPINLLADDCVQSICTENLALVLYCRLKIQSLVPGNTSEWPAK